jgi:hypothetical protein
MRNRWEDKGDDQDEPVTITGKELRSLKFGARAGLFALILSLVAAGAAGWTVYRGMQATKPAPVEPEAAATQAPAAVDTATAQPASTAPEGTPTASSTPAATPPAVTAQPSTPTHAARHTVKAVNAESRTSSRRGARTASHSPTPKMESFDPTPVAPSGVPTQTPIVPTAPVKSASPDTSSNH